VDPPNRQNPDPSKFFMVVLEVEPEVALQHCRNAESCICVRAMRSQSYRALGLALGFRGAGNQATWHASVLKFVRGAWGYPNEVEGQECPAWELSHLAAYQNEPNPEPSMVANFIAVLKRLPL
jgi:hypothetical protein